MLLPLYRALNDLAESHKKQRLEIHSRIWYKPPSKAAIINEGEAYAGKHGQVHDNNIRYDKHSIFCWKCLKG